MNMLKFISSLLKALPFNSVTTASSQSEVLEPEMNTEPFAEVLTPELQTAERKALFATQIYIDLDNVFGQLRPEVLEVTLTKLDDFILALVAKFPAPVKVAAYGNLTHWQLFEQRWEWQKNLAEFIDTPVKDSRRGKTITDEIMITHIARQATANSTTVLVSCDVGFGPILTDINEHDGVRTELVLFGHASYQLKQAALVSHSGMDILASAGFLTTEMAKTLLISNLEASLSDTIPLPTVAHWLADFKAEWRHIGFKHYLSSLVPDNWIVDGVNNQIRNLNQTSVHLDITSNDQDTLFQKLSLPSLSSAHFKTLFEVAAKLKTRNIDAIKDAVVEALYDQQLSEVPDADILAVLGKILPQLASKQRPRQLAKAYRTFLLHKARLMKLNLAQHERLYLSRLLSN
ncbi:TPA: NYN domain-containing protein [Vibrio vulnificus]|nr:NYN domain-containing protein [Vibrio vulnificus]